MVDLCNIIIKESFFTYRSFSLDGPVRAVGKGTEQLQIKEHVGFLDTNICLKETKLVLILAFVFWLEQ